MVVNTLRIALGIEYDGSQYHGWQSQQGLRTAQGMLEKAISRVAAETVQVTCAGRTDTGVHGMNQVVHFSTDVERPLRSWIFGTNSYLPKDMVVKWAKWVSDDFDARFSACARRYRYIIYNHAIRPAHLRSLVTWHYQSLDVELMHEESQALLGENDFTSFRSTQCQSKTPMRCINQITVKKHEQLIFIDVEANAFLHHMVRNIVGVLISVGSGRHGRGWVKELLALRDRTKGAETAPAYGLYLFDVIYPSRYGIPRSKSYPLHISSPFGLSEPDM